MHPAAAEPYMPSEGTEVLDNLAFDLAREASELSGHLHPLARLSVGELVRSMNCYYSNLIEVNKRNPGNSNAELSADYPPTRQNRDLHLKPQANIEVQRR